MLSRITRTTLARQLISTRAAMAFSTTSTAAFEDDVIFENINTAKVITLNRPKKLNSLNESMVDKLYPRLVEYSKSQLTEVIIQKANGRAFCAGGDVNACAQANEQGKSDESIRFFQKEYSLNYLYAGYPKPVVSLMDGITMGGGVGLSIHTPFRIATENTRWAMPEMDIGFSPDVGTTFSLNKVVPSSLGWFLALTGENVFGWDAYFAGIATHFVPAHRLPELIKSLANVSVKNADSFAVVNNVIEDFTEPLPQNYKFKFSAEQLTLLESLFTPSSTVESIFEGLQKDGSEFAIKALETMKKKSPLSLKVALELLQRGSQSNIHEALTNELHAAKQFMKDSDFNEGVNAKLVRKTDAKWRHQTPSAVSVKEILPFVKPDSKLKVDVNFDVTFTEYPHNFGLPKESEIQAFIEGADDKRNISTVTKKDVIEHFCQHSSYKHKAGLVEYLRLVLNSKVTDANQTLKWKL